MNWIPKVRKVSRHQDYKHEDLQGTRGVIQWSEHMPGIHKAPGLILVDYRKEKLGR